MLFKIDHWLWSLVRGKKYQEWYFEYCLVNTLISLNWPIFKNWAVDSTVASDTKGAWVRIQSSATFLHIYLLFSRSWRNYASVKMKSLWVRIGRYHQILGSICRLKCFWFEKTKDKRKRGREWRILKNNTLKRLKIRKNFHRRSVAIGRLETVWPELAKFRHLG